MAEVRKVQQVGYSTLVVSLPREWVKEVGLKQGDSVSITREEDGTLRVVPGTVPEETRALRCVIDAEKCREKRLLTRVITGLYIIGYDTIHVTARHELSQEHIEEVRQTAQRLTGISIVEQTLRSATLQSFVDPTRFPVYGLLRRLHVITSSIRDGAVRALQEKRPELAVSAMQMEDEVDRIYWLVVRQLLSAARVPGVMKKIGVETPLHLVGNRTVAKALENIGDYSEDLARAVHELLEAKIELEADLSEGIANLFTLVRRIQDQAIQALTTLDLRLANETLELVKQAEELEFKLREDLMRWQMRPSKKGMPLPQATSATEVRLMLWSLGEIAQNCSIVAEITINRSVEGAGDIVRLEPVPAS
jgi:phosphate uptake regulator